MRRKRLDGTTAQFNELYGTDLPGSDLLTAWEQIDNPRLLIKVWRKVMHDTAPLVAWVISELEHPAVFSVIQHSTELLDAYLALPTPSRPGGPDLVSRAIRALSWPSKTLGVETALWYIARAHVPARLNRRAAERAVAEIQARQCRSFRGTYSLRIDAPHK